MSTRWENGGHVARRLRNEMDRVFESFFDDLPGFSPVEGWMAASGFPAVNLWEDEEAFHVEAELPGLEMKDLELLVVANELTIKGERKPPEREGATPHRRERQVGRFSRLLRLPLQVDADRVHATLQNGVLTVKLPKAASVKPRRIEVKASGK